MDSFAIDFYMMIKQLFYFSILILSFGLKAQKSPKKILPKVHHAEPLYIDLMRDLGARKGEAEFNLGFGIANFDNYKEYNGFIEYEWAVADRLGLEVEVPFRIEQAKGNTSSSVPDNSIEGIKLATQYTFLVSEKTQTSLAVGYIHEFELNSFKALQDKGKMFTGMKLNPIFVAAKKFNHFNTMIYAGPIIERHFNTKHTEVLGAINTSVLYVIPNSKNFIGIENNIEFNNHEFHDVLRPQFKLALMHNLAVGLVTGIPLTRGENMNLDIMTRIIWEP